MQAEIDDKLIQEIRRVAEQEGRSAEAVVEEALLLWLRLRNQFVHSRTSSRAESEVFSRAGSLGEFFDRVHRWQVEHGVEPLSDEEAMKLAVEEQHAYRREKAGREGAGR